MSEATGGYFYDSDVEDYGHTLFRWVDENGGERIALGEVYDYDVIEKIVFLLNENMAKEKEMQHQK